MLIVVLLIIGLILFSFSGLKLLAADSRNHICHEYKNYIFIIVDFIILLLL